MITFPHFFIQDTIADIFKKRSGCMLSEAVALARFTALHPRLYSEQVPFQITFAGMLVRLFALPGVIKGVLER